MISLARLKLTPVLLFLSLALLSVSAPDAASARLEQLISQDWEYQMRTEPERATAIGDNRFNDKLSEYSPAAFAQRMSHDRALLAELQKISPEQLSREEQLNRTLMLRTVQTRIEAQALNQWEMPVNQMNGPHLEYASMAEEMPFESVRDYDNYLARLRQLPRVFAQLKEAMRLGMHDHLMPPRYLLEKVAEEAGAVADKPADESLFTTPLKHFPEKVPQVERQRLTGAIKQAVGEEVLPAYAAFASFVKSEYAPKGRTEYGIWSLPDGDNRYRQAIREMTTTEMNAADLHNLGLKQVVEIERQMLAIARQQGFADLRSFNAHIFADRSLYGTSGGQVLSFYQKCADQMYAKLPQYFGRLPKNKLVVVPMEAYRAPHEVPADYSIGAGDGSRPGRINVNEYDPTHRLMLNAEAIAYHEGVPGHHLQFSIAQELSGLPPFRKFAEYNAYSEGWALYAETLSREIGFYQDPYSEYGRLENLMWRSIRLVVDTGVHWQHWSRQRMIDFFHDHTAMDEQNIESEVDRYIAWPGQALGYKLGEMTILRLRAKAHKELGAKFDIRLFHDAVLERGPLPLDVLETEMDRWISARAKASQ